jgi:Putative adhesin
MSRVFKKIQASIFAILLTITFAGIIAGQHRPMPEKKPAPKPRPEIESMPATPLPPRSGHGGTYERSIATDARVSLSLCVTEGSVKVNGWSRNEVRIFVREGSKVGFKVLQKNRQSEMPVWIMAVGYEPKGAGFSVNECIWGNDVEIDVPQGASVSLKGKETTTVIDSIRKAEVRNVGGDIVVRNVTEGVTAATYRGDVAVENVDGALSLESSIGNILASEVGPAQVGDVFRAKTNGGAISLQNISHRDIDVNSISGSLLYNGAFLSGGSYRFSTTNGSMTLSLPQDVSCRINASYGYGNFRSDFPIKPVTEDISTGPIKRINGILGTGDATLKLTTSSGQIALRRQ